MRAYMLNENTEQARNDWAVSIFKQLKRIVRDLKITEVQEEKLDWTPDFLRVVSYTKKFDTTIRVFVNDDKDDYPPTFRPSLAHLSNFDARRALFRATKLTINPIGPNNIILAMKIIEKFSFGNQFDFHDVELGSSDSYDKGLEYLKLMLGKYARARIKQRYGIYAKIKRRDLNELVKVEIQDMASESGL